MWLERIELDGFGRFHDASWELTEGVTVLLGANEAGKTTLLNALRALLFGFESSRDGRAWYPALAGGRRGGRLVLRTDAGERWVVERHGERGGGGALAVRAPNGNQGGQETLDRLLHGADRDLFNNIFAFGLGELQTLASLSAEGVQGRIYGAGTGLGGTSAVDLERRLRQALDATFLPRGSQRPLNQLLARIEEVRGLVADLARQPQQYADAHEERDLLRQRAAALRDQARAAREQTVRLRHVREAAPVAATIAELEAALAGTDPTLEDVPADAVAQLDRRLSAVAEARAVIATIDEQIEDARRARSATTTDPMVLTLRDEIAAVAAESAERAALHGRRRDLEAAADRQDAIVAEQLARVGRWHEARLLALDDSIPTVEATRELEAAMHRARASKADADAAHRNATEALARLEGARAGTGPTEDEDVLRDRVAAVRELDTVRIALAGSRAIAPSRAWLGLAATIGVLGVIVGVVLDALLVGTVAGAVLAIVVASLTPRGAADGSALRARRAMLLARLGLPPTADDAEVRDVADVVVAARVRMELDGEGSARLAGTRAEVETRDAERTTAGRAADAATAAWSAWLEEHGLPHGLSPDAARHVLAAAGVARRAAIERNHHRAELAAIERDEAAHRARVDSLLDAAGTPAASDSERNVRLAALVDRRARGVDAERAAEELDARISGLEARRLPAAAVAAEREAALCDYLTALGCSDEDALRGRAAAAAARRETAAELREQRAHLLGLAGTPDAIDLLVAEARRADPAALDAAAEEAHADLERLESEEREAMSRIGALDARIEQLEGAEELGLRRQELAVLEGQAASLARQWAVRAVALRLLEETRARYERERQPDVIRAAERHFERITGGRYGRIVAPPGDASVRVETEGGVSRITDELSRGTAEQLYLALRFGLIEEFARHAEPLPVVMDDILVNFDAERAGRAATAIRALAERHQVLLFTCHAWTAELLDPGGERTLALG